MSRERPPAKTTLVVPCFNEAERLPRRDFLEFLADHELSFLFVDDGSADRTADVIEELRADAPQSLTLLRLPVNGGKGEAVRQGLLAALANGAELVGYIDADLAAPLSEVWPMLRYFDDPELLAVTGARVHLHGSWIERRAFRHYAGRVFATVASSVLGRPFYDTQCGAKIFRAHPALESALGEPFSSPWIFDVELLARLFADAEARGIRGVIVREHPLREWRDVGGSHVRASSFLRAPLELVRMSRALRRRGAK